MAIGIHIKKADRVYDLGTSKFFGTPTVPSAWETDFDEDEIFFCQIRLRDIAALDTENRLPHTGYLYVFLYTRNGNRDLMADVRYYDGEPEMAIDDFNATVPGYEICNDAWLMEFSPAEEDGDQTRLLGIPSDWNYAEAPPRLLLQFDPLDNPMGFLRNMDGFLYLFFGENTSDLTAVTLHAEYS